MPVASGSIAFLGAARFQGFWNASINHATGSGLQNAVSGAVVGLFKTGSSTAGGYAPATGLTASAGHYWQVTGSGSHNIEGETTWRLNDWVIYSGSAGGSGTWSKLSFNDTIASIILGDLSSSSFHMGISNDKHVIFNTGSVHSGSKNFTYDYSTDRLLLTASLNIGDDKKIYFGAANDASIEYDENGTDQLRFAGAGAIFGQDITGSKGISMPDDIKLRFGNATGGDATIEYDENGTNELRFAGAAATFEQDVTFDNDVTLGVATGDVATVTGRLTASRGLQIADDMKLRFGAGAGDATFEYDENGTDTLLYAGSSLRISDDTLLQFGTGGDASIEYDENGTDELRFAGAAATFEQDVTFDNNVTLGVAAGDVATVTGQLTASRGLVVPDDMKLRFGSATSGDATIEYDENGTDQLRFAGAAAIFGQDITGSKGISMPDNIKLRFGDATGGDAHIRYAETGNDHLIISGSSTGLVVSGSQVVISGDKEAHWQRHTVQVTGAMNVQYLTGSKGMTIPDDQKLRFGSAVGGDVTIEYDEDGINTLLISGGDVTIADDKKLYFGTGKDASIEYDEDGTNHLRFAGASTIFEGNLTGSKGMIIQDDMKLRFGGTVGNAHIRYAETGNDHLIISGSSTGLVISGSQIVVSGDKSGQWWRHTVQVTGAMNVQHLTASMGIGIPDDKKLRFGNAMGGDVSIKYDESGTDTLLVEGGNVAIVDDKKLYFGSGKDASIEYDEDGTDELRFAGAAATFEQDVTFDNNVTLGVAAGDVITSTGQLTASRGMVVPDDRQLRFGSATGGDAHIRYAETGIDHLIVSGSATGLTLSGSKLYLDAKTVASGTIEGSGSYLGLNSAGYVVLTTSSAGGSGTVTALNNKAESRLLTYGSTTTELDGEANLTYNGTTFTINDDTMIKDDHKLYFGTNSDAHIRYAETGIDHMIISGSVAGTVLSGSRIIISADQHQLFSRDAVQVSGAMNVQYLTGSKGMSIPDNQKLRFGSAAGGDVTLQYDEASTDTLLIEGGNVAVADDKKLYFGTGKDASIEYDEDGTDELRFAGAAASFEQDVTFDNDVVLGAAAGDITTVTGRLTASRGLLISDDMKLRFGAGAGDATFEYDEDSSDTLLYAGANMRISDDIQLQFGNSADATIKYAETGNDHLIISGSSTGLVLSGSQVVISGDKSAHWQRHTVQVTGAMNVQYLTGSKGMMIPDDQKLRFGSAVGGDVTIEYDEDGIDTLLISGGDVTIADDKKLYFGTGKDASLEYDEDGTDELRFAGAAATFEQDVTFDNNVTLGVAAGDVTTVTGQLTASRGLVVPDDMKLRFGSAASGDATIEYDENGDDYMIISGSAKGLAISGSHIGVDALKTGIATNAPETTLSVGKGKHVVSVEQNLRFAHSGDNTVIVELPGVVIPKGAIITSVAAVMKSPGAHGGGLMTTFLTNIQLSATSGTNADSSISSGTEILGAGATGTKSIDSDSAEDINLAYSGMSAVDPNEVWINQTLVKNASADQYVYVCNAGTGNGTTNPITGTLLIIIEYYGLT
jgi:hypothetical protein